MSQIQTNKIKKISLLGGTGSIGKQTLDLIRKAPNQYKLSAVAFGSNVSEAVQIINEFNPQLVSFKEADSINYAREACIKSIQYVHGESGLCEVAKFAEADTVLVAVVGAVGLEPTLEALKHAKRVVVANKETLVAAGDLIKEYILKYGGSIIPADSEHVALHQCLEAKSSDQVRNLILTASGGPFRNSDLDFSKITPEQALNHPTWSMGAKITIDCATLMNKGLEVIEAERLFGIDYDRIQVLVHPQSLIHGLVEFVDGNILAQLGPNDMRLAIQYGLNYPTRSENLSKKFLNFKEIRKLEFEEPDFVKFPCLRLAYEAGRAGKTYPAVLGAVDEVAVELFLKGEIRFSDIPQIIDLTLQNHHAKHTDSLETIRAADAWARKEALAQLERVKTA